jgi:hypothetical protein
MSTLKFWLKESWPLLIIALLLLGLLVWGINQIISVG